MPIDDAMPGEGWYADPDGKPAERYWDGDDWTDRTRPFVSSTAAEPEFDGDGGLGEAAGVDLPDPPGFLDERQQAEYRARQEKIRNRQRRAAASTKSCPRCGTANELTKRLCVDCGAPIAKVKPDDQGQVSTYAEKTPSRRREWVRPALFVGALGVLVFVISLCNKAVVQKKPRLPTLATLWARMSSASSSSRSSFALPAPPNTRRPTRKGRPTWAVAAIGSTRMLTPRTGSGRSSAPVLSAQWNT